MAVKQVLDQQIPNIREIYFCTQSLFGMRPEHFFPIITIKSLYNHEKDFLKSHFERVIERLLPKDQFGPAKQRAKSITEERCKPVFDRDEAGLLFRLLGSHLDTQCSKIFGVPATSSMSCSGCLENEFSANFMDSEQSFLTLLEDGISQEKIFKESFVESIDPTQVQSIRWCLFSPRDICRFCRGTMSYELHKESNLFIRAAANILLGIQDENKSTSVELQNRLKNRVEVLAYTLYPLDSPRM